MTPQTLSMEFSRQAYWSGLPFFLLGCLPDPGIEPVSLVSPALAGGGFTSEPSGSLMDADPVEIIVQSCHRAGKASRLPDLLIS